MDNIIKKLPKMKTGRELISALSFLPESDESVRIQDKSQRLIALSDLYRIYIPSKMSIEIYSRLYLALLCSLQKKTTKAATVQRNENHKIIVGREHNGILGGTDSFTIIGTSGIGKSSAINRTIELLSENGIIETTKPYNRIIPCLVVQCPFDCSVKGILLEILRKTDEILGTDYFRYSVKSRAATTDMLIGLVSSIALNHIGLLIVDEIQNVANSKNGKNLVGMLTQLINNSGIGICMVGTPECVSVFETNMQMARRSLGLIYTPLKYDEFFSDFCKTVFNYQYTRIKAEICEQIINWLYEHSNGIVSVVISLFHDAQEIAILNDSEIVDTDVLNEAYKNRIKMLHGYISQNSNKKAKTSVNANNNAFSLKQNEPSEEPFSIYDVITQAKNNGGNVVNALKDYITVEEICL